MNFNNFDYKRPALEEVNKSFTAAIKQFSTAANVDHAKALFSEIAAIRSEFMSMYSIAHIRHTVDTKDDFYEKEQTYFDTNMPSYQDLVTQFYKALLKTPYRDAIEKEWGDQLFVIAELSLKVFDAKVLEDLKKENKLSSDYVKIKASAEIEFRGEKYNLSGFIPLETDQDGDTRKAAAEAKWKFYAKKSEQVEKIFDELVQTRHRIAKALGYNNFVELGYNRMMRSDYNAKDVAFYREQILKYIVPMASDIYARQTKRLGLDSIKIYDENFSFASGNPKPKGDPDFIIAGAKKMYEELSKETGSFFNFMLDNNLMDLVNKEGKATGGYCTYVSKHKSPFIFSNFNGTSGDIDVLTHEAGHAFQVYSSKEIGLSEYNWPTYEAAEIHSMSMEFFTWPWMHLFFEEDVEKYKFAHLSGAIKFLPYGVAVDEFQHFVYENPDCGIQGRNEAWLAIEKKYLPHRDNDGIPFLEKGGLWQRQNHIFASPFYYIDYTLAQVCAFQFWKKDREDHTSAWADYVQLCKAGGSQSFLDLVKTAKLDSPFDPGTVEKVSKPIRDYLDSVDDSSL
jgi:M3 family oligoendopeptidase